MNVINFNELLARADDETLQELVGQPVVRLLDLLDRRLARPSVLRSIVTDLHLPEELLRDASQRERLFSLLPAPSAEHLEDFA